MSTVECKTYTSKYSAVYCFLCCAMMCSSCAALCYASLRYAMLCYDTSCDVLSFTHSHPYVSAVYTNRHLSLYACVYIYMYSCMSHSCISLYCRMMLVCSYNIVLLVSTGILQRVPVLYNSASEPNCHVMNI